MNHRISWCFAIFFGIFPILGIAIGKPKLAQNQGILEDHPYLDQDQIQNGWISLFDGKSLFGWKAVTEANWHVKAGEIRVGEGEKGLLRTTSQFDDFELVVDFKAAPNTNSGLFLRTSPSPKHVIHDCYELNIASRQTHEYPTGSLVGRAKSQLDITPDAWHQFRILADGDRIKVWVDGELAVSYLDPQPLGRGYIGLQFNSGDAAFRNLALKPLNLDGLFEGKDLSAWNLNQQRDSKFEITADQALKMTGGPGQLESNATYGDFVFSMRCRTNADGLNSGVFFRCIPGDLMNGYESQIQNQIVDNDPTRPVDCGTGGIFRRVDARSVNARDQQWFAKTIFATGPHISVWVNGYQVTDWSDTRQPDPNPRKGRRLEPGTLILQGHDPTTDLLFKQILAKELSPRRPTTN